MQTDSRKTATQSGVILRKLEQMVRGNLLLYVLARRIVSRYLFRYIYEGEFRAFKYLNFLDAKTKLFRITFSGTLVLITFLITNPYVVIDFFEFTNYWLTTVTPKNYSGYSYVPSLATSFHSVYFTILDPKNLSLFQIPFIAMVVLSVLWAVLAKQRPWR